MAKIDPAWRRSFDLTHPTDVSRFQRLYIHLIHFTHCLIPLFFFLRFPLSPARPSSQPPSPSFPSHNFRTPSPPLHFPQLSPTLHPTTLSRAPTPEIPLPPSLGFPWIPEKLLPLLLPLSLSPFPSPRACSCALQVTLAAHAVAHPLPPPAHQRMYLTIHNPTCWVQGWMQLPWASRSYRGFRKT